MRFFAINILFILSFESFGKNFIHLMRESYPTSEKIEILNDKVGISARKTCGQTDLSTIMFHAPKQLLSLDHYKPLGKKLYESAKKFPTTFLRIQTSYLMMNAVPQFKQWLDHGEVMASVNLTFNKDDCKIWEEINGINEYEYIELNSCVTNVMNSNNDLSSDQAKVKCVSDEDFRRKSKKEQGESISRKASVGEGSVDFKKSLFSDVFLDSNGRGTKRKLSRSYHREMDILSQIPFISVDGGIIQYAMSPSLSDTEKHLEDEGKKVETDIEDLIVKIEEVIKKGGGEYDINKTMDNVVLKNIDNSLLRTDPLGQRRGYTLAKEVFIEFAHTSLNNKNRKGDYLKIKRQLVSTISRIQLENYLVDLKNRLKVACISSPRLQGMMEQRKCSSAKAVITSHLDNITRIEQTENYINKRSENILHSIESLRKI